VLSFCWFLPGEKVNDPINIIGFAFLNNSKGTVWQDFHKGGGAEKGTG
jgi:hypothetical protein